MQEVVVTTRKCQLRRSSNRGRLLRQLNNMDHTTIESSNSMDTLIHQNSCAINLPDDVLS